MSKDDLINFIKTYSSEYHIFSTELKDANKNLEEKLELLKKECEEQKEMNKNHKQENINLNKELESFHSLKVENEQVRKELEAANGIIIKQQAEIKTNHNAIAESDKMIAKLNAGLISNNDVFKVEENKLKKQIERQKGVIEEMRMEQEALALEKANEANKFSQEKTELRKAIAISERTISHLMKEKSLYEARNSHLQAKLDKTSSKVFSKETQTEYIEMTNIKSIEDKEKLIMQQDKLNTANHYSIELSTELKSLQLKYSKLQKQNSEFEKKESERTNLIKSIENEKVVLIKENADLKKRRELAMNEIKKLNEQISKKGPKSKGGPRNMSAAVIYY